MPKQRIISLVPSITELLYDLGLDEEVVGITRFCVAPPTWFSSKPRIGGTKNLHLQEIAALHPTLIIANKEENIKEQVEALQEKFQVLLTDVATLGDAVDMIAQIGQLTLTAAKAAEIITSIENGFRELEQTNKATPVKAAYIIWQNPVMTVGKDTFIHHLMEYAGFSNAFAASSRYPVVDENTIANPDIDYILLSSEPYPFKEKHLAEWQQKYPDKKIMLVDGTLFSWYGSRLMKSAAYLRELRLKS